jgi:large subunit ribosomal protein L30
MVKKIQKDEQKTIIVTQIGSSIGRDESQRKTLIGLGLNKIGRSRKLSETPDILGMVSKVRHLLKVEQA